MVGRAHHEREDLGATRSSTAALWRQFVGSECRFLPGRHPPLVPASCLMCANPEASPLCKDSCVLGRGVEIVPTGRFRGGWDGLCHRSRVVTEAQPVDLLPDSRGRHKRGAIEPCALLDQPLRPQRSLHGEAGVASSSELGAWSSELGASSSELGTWSSELGAWSAGLRWCGSQSGTRGPQPGAGGCLLQTSGSTLGRRSPQRGAPGPELCSSGSEPGT